MKDAAPPFLASHERSAGTQHLASNLLSLTFSRRGMFRACAWECLIAD